MIAWSADGSPAGGGASSVVGSTDWSGPGLLSVARPAVSTWGPVAWEAAGNVRRALGWPGVLGSGVGSPLAGVAAPARDRVPSPKLL